MVKRWGECVKGSVFVFSLWVLVMSALSITMQYSQYMDLRLSINHIYHKALHSAMGSEDLETFKRVFLQEAPKGVHYDIELVDYHEYPRLRRVSVGAVYESFEYQFEETMIEELAYE